MFPQLGNFTDLALLLLRLMVAVVFAASGIRHLQDRESRSKDIGMSKGFTVILGAAELLGGRRGSWSIDAARRCRADPAHARAVQKKIFVWRTGFWGKNNNGWHYDLMLVVMNLVIIATNGGRWVLWK